MPNYVLGLTLSGTELDVLEEAMTVYAEHCERQIALEQGEKYHEHACLLQAIKLKLFDDVTLTSTSESYIDTFDVSEPRNH